MTSFFATSRSKSTPLPELAVITAFIGSSIFASPEQEESIRSDTEPRSLEFEQTGWSEDTLIRNGWIELPLGKSIFFDYSRLFQKESPAYWSDSKGFLLSHEPSGNWREWDQLALEYRKPGMDEVQVAIQLHAPPGAGPDAVGKEAHYPLEVTMVLDASEGEVTIPLEAFSRFASRPPRLLGYVYRVEIIANSLSDGRGSLEITNLRLERSFPIDAQARIRSRSARNGESLKYPVEITNTTDKSILVSLDLINRDWESFQSEVSPSYLSIPPRSTGVASVNATAPLNAPPGAREKVTLRIVPDGNFAEAKFIEFTHLVSMPHPYLLLDDTGWDAVRSKITEYSWARKLADIVLEDASKWKVPTIAQAPRNISRFTKEPYLFGLKESENALNAAIAWKLSGNQIYADKVREFLLRLSDPVKGYPNTLQAAHYESVHEGLFFQETAQAYDLILSSGTLTAEEKEQINETLRLYMEVVEHIGGLVSNWTVATMVGALNCALVVQDWERVERFMDGPDGLSWQIRRGILDDGWWYELSPHYNLWVASMLTQSAIALDPWGVNWTDAEFPAVYSDDLIPEGSGEENIQSQFGVSSKLHGTSLSNSRRIKDLWDSLVPYVNEDGRMFGINDTAPEIDVSGSGYDLAYYLYRDPNYAKIIQTSEDHERNLLFGIGELPDWDPETPLPNAISSYAGIATLRSQGEEIKEASDQIQVGTKYGLHGYYHGHFDRGNLVYLRKNGKIATSTRTTWFGYPNFMYKFYVQTTTAHSLPVIDGKMQLPGPSELKLWYDGTDFEAIAMDVSARWAFPPYGGMVYPYKTKSLDEKSEQEGRWLPLPEDAPQYGELTEVSDVIPHTRMIITTSRYVVVVDDIQADSEQTIDNLLQLRGFRGISGEEVQFKGERPQLDDNPLSANQFVTNCSIYEATGSTTVNFRSDYFPGNPIAPAVPTDEATESLAVSVHLPWPPKKTVTIGTAPEIPVVAGKLRFNAKQTSYEIFLDGEKATNGTQGFWILGEKKIDLDLEGVSSMEIRAEINPRNAGSLTPSLILADAMLTLDNGKEVELSSLSLVRSNILEKDSPDLDFEGGPIIIAGVAAKHGLSLQPRKIQSPSSLTINLEGLNAKRFQARLGSDFPVGDQSQRINTMSVQVSGEVKRIVSVLDLYQLEPNVVSASMQTPENLEIKTGKGEVHQWKFPSTMIDSSIPLQMERYDADGTFITKETTDNES